MFDWRENLDLAEALGAGMFGSPVAVPGSEATRRCAVGRAYYAAFGHARAYAVRHPGFAITGTPSDHGHLVAHFQSLGEHRLAARLRTLRHWRNQCDYDDVVPHLSRMVRTAIRDAAAVVSQL